MVQPYSKIQKTENNYIKFVNANRTNTNSQKKKGNLKSNGPLQSIMVLYAIKKAHLRPVAYLRGGGNRGICPPKY